MQLGPPELTDLDIKEVGLMIPCRHAYRLGSRIHCLLSFAVFSVETWTAKRNADLVKIGVSVLRVDPEKEKQISAARKWALELIDANAGGVTFSQEAKEQLLKEPLKYTRLPTLRSPTIIPPQISPPPRRPAPEPPK